MTDEELEKRLSGAFNFSDDEDEKVKSFLKNDKTNFSQVQQPVAQTEVKTTPNSISVKETEVRPYGTTTVTPFGEHRMPTGFEKALGIDPVVMTELNRQSALGLDANGVFTPRGNFETAHKFKIGDYLRQAVAEKERGDYSLKQEGVFDKINKFFTAPDDEAKATEQAYAANAFDDKIQNLIDDIVMYNSFQKQLGEANASNTMPKVRADVGTTDGPDSRQLNRLLFGSGYKGPESRDWTNTYSHVYDTLSDMGKDDRKAVEKDVYRMLSEISKYK